MSRIALVTRARAPYHKALHEAFAGALGPDSRLGIFYPKNSWRIFDDAGMMPAGETISVEWVDSARLSGGMTRLLAEYKSEAIGTQLPSLALWRALTGFRPDLVWAHEYSPYTLAAIWWAKTHRIPVVVSTDVGRDNRHFFPSVVRIWHRFWSHLADGIIAGTPSARQPLSGGTPPVVEAYHAADSRDFIPRARRHEVGTQFVYVGRLIPRKGIDLLLAAAARLKSQGRADWSIRMIGLDPDGYGRDLIARLGLKKEVTITGHLEGDALREAFADGDAFVLASRQDTYAAVVHEAACLGLPLLVSQHAGAADALVRDGVNGFKIDPDDVDAFAGRMAAMCDTQKREPMSRASRRTGEEFSAHRRGPAVWRWMQESFALPSPLI